MEMQIVGNTGGLGSAWTTGGDGTLGAAYSTGGDGTLGAAQMMGLDQFGQPSRSIWPIFWGVASLASAGACAYHGYKRNESVGWAVVWGLLGGMFPVVSVAVGLAQGFGKSKV